ncbi:hypothetical protein SLA2020_183140 [Shorea laevis]
MRGIGLRACRPSHRETGSPRRRRPEPWALRGYQRNRQPSTLYIFSKTDEEQGHDDAKATGDNERTTAAEARRAAVAVVPWTSRPQIGLQGQKNEAQLWGTPRVSVPKGSKGTA